MCKTYQVAPVFVFGRKLQSCCASRPKNFKQQNIVFCMMISYEYGSDDDGDGGDDSKSSLKRCCPKLFGQNNSKQTQNKLFGKHFLTSILYCTALFFFFFFRGGGGSSLETHNSNDFCE